MKGPSISKYLLTKIWKTSDFCESLSHKEYQTQDINGYNDEEEYLKSLKRKKDVLMIF